MKQTIERRRPSEAEDSCCSTTTATTAASYFGDEESDLFSAMDASSNSCEDDHHHHHHPLTSKPPQFGRNVSFGKVDVRVYERVIQDSTWLGLGWHYNKETVAPVDDFEQARNGQR